MASQPYQISRDLPANPDACVFFDERSHPLVPPRLADFILTWNEPYCGSLRTSTENGPDSCDRNSFSEKKIIRSFWFSPFPICWHGGGGACDMYCNQPLGGDPDVYSSSLHIVSGSSCIHSYDFSRHFSPIKKCLCVLVNTASWGPGYVYNQQSEDISPKWGHLGRSSHVPSFF